MGRLFRIRQLPPGRSQGLDGRRCHVAIGELANVDIEVVRDEDPRAGGRRRYGVGDEGGMARPCHLISARPETSPGAASALGVLAGFGQIGQSGHRPAHRFPDTHAAETPVLKYARRCQDDFRQLSVLPKIAGAVMPAEISCAAEVPTMFVSRGFPECRRCCSGIAEAKECDAHLGTPYQGDWRSSESV